MATLSATTVGNLAASPSAWPIKANGDMEVIASANDATFGADNTNTGGTTTLDQGYLLNDMPSDFGFMTALSVQARYGWAAAFSNRTWTVFGVRIVRDSDGAVLAAANSGGAFQTVNTGGNITATTPTNSPTVAFGYIDTAAIKADWDDARVEMRIVSVRSAGGSAIARRVHAFQVTGTYDVFVAALGRVKTSGGASKPTKIFPDADTKPVKTLTAGGWKTLP